MKKVMKDIFLKFIFNNLNYMNFTWTYHFYQKEWNLQKSKSLLLVS